MKDAQVNVEDIEGFLNAVNRFSDATEAAVTDFKRAYRIKQEEWRDSRFQQLENLVERLLTSHIRAVAEMDDLISDAKKALDDLQTYVNR